jgi:hypothetical protein
MRRRKELPNFNQKLQKLAEFQECVSNMHPLMAMNKWRMLKKLVG